VKHRAVLVVVGLTGVLALVASLSVAAAGARPTHKTASAAINPPAVKNASKIRAKYKGQKITFVGDADIGLSHKRDLALAKRFQTDTGITVTVIPHPKDSDASYQQLARNFSSHSSSFDVVMIDVVWPGAFASYLVDLKKPLAKEAKQQAKGIVQNDTVNGHLVAMPWFGDFGILYFRKDLLKKYHFSHPPKTWKELGSMAKTIQSGERPAHKNFYGFVYQGNSYEGLTCDALEWIASSNGGHFVDGSKASINNAHAVGILNLFRGWVGSITPRGVTSYGDEEARNAFDAGNAAFMRNWPYAYAASQTTPVKGKFDVTVLPHGSGGKSVGTVGGWQVAVSKYTKHKGAAIEWVRYLTSPGVEKYDAIYNGNVPTIPKVALDKAVRKANPYLKPAIATVSRVTRPARYFGTHYAAASQAIYQGINQIENGQDAKNVLPTIASRLNRLLKR